MRLHDPDRPKNQHGQIELLHGGIAPVFYIGFPDPGKARVTFFLNTVGFNYRPFTHELKVNDMDYWLREYRANPEAFLLEYFNYNGPEKSKHKLEKKQRADRGADEYHKQASAGNVRKRVRL